MTASRLFRVGVVALVLGAILGLVGAAITPNMSDVKQQLASPFFYPSNWLLLLGGILSVIAFPAAYVRIATKTGKIGLLGFIGVMLTGILLGIFNILLNIMILPFVVQQVSSSALQQGPSGFAVFFPVAAFFSLVGALLFGLALIRTKAYSSWLGYFWLLTAVVNVLSIVASLPYSNPGAAFYYIALGWTGVELWRSVERMAAASRMSVIDDAQNRRAA